MKIGERVIFRNPHSTHIDMTRPCLIRIGNDVDINVDFTILTHAWCTHVFRNLFHDFLNSSGKVSIGNNVYIAKNVMIYITRCYHWRQLYNRCWIRCE